MAEDEAFTYDMPEVHAQWFADHGWKSAPSSPGETFAPNFTKMTPAGILHSVYWDGRRAYDSGKPTYQLESTVPQRGAKGGYVNIRPDGADDLFETDDPQQVQNRAKENEQTWLTGSKTNPGIMYFMDPDNQEYDSRFLHRPVDESPSQSTEFGKFTEPKEQLHPLWRGGPDGRAGLHRLNAVEEPDGPAPARRDWDWEEAPPGRGHPQDRPWGPSPRKTGEAGQSEPEKVDEWHSLGQMHDANGKKYHVRWGQGQWNSLFGQAIDPDVDHSEDNADNDHEAVIKWNPYDGEIAWRGAARSHSGGYLSMFLKDHLMKNLPHHVIAPQHSTNLTSAGMGSLRRYQEEYGDPHGDITPALRANDYGYDGDDEDREDEDQEPEGFSQEDLRNLANHGFVEDGTGDWNKEFNHPDTHEKIEEHTISPESGLSVYSRGLDGRMINNRPAGQNRADVRENLERSRHGFAERHLPDFGWTPHYKDPAFDNWGMGVHQPPAGTSGRETRHELPYKWTKTTPVEGDAPYHSTITMPRGAGAPAYRLDTTREGHEDNLYDEDGDLSGNILHQEARWTKGIHNGGRRDLRLTHPEFHQAVQEHFGRPADVARGSAADGNSHEESTPEDNAGRTGVVDGGWVSAEEPHSHDPSRSVTPVLGYNWDTGQYEGRTSWAMHAMPGRQMTLPMHVAAVVPGDPQHGLGHGHTAPASGPTMDDPEDAGLLDVYDHPEYYVSPRDSRDPLSHRSGMENWRAVKAARGNPDAQVKIYRAVPHGITDIEGHTNPAGASWVSASPSYALRHAQAESCPSCGGDMQVISGTARAGDLHNEGYLEEWGYTGGPLHDASALTECPEGAYEARKAAEAEFMKRQGAALGEMSVKQYEGTEGNNNHITRNEQGMIPLDWVRNMPGLRGERPGEHRNYDEGSEWDEFRNHVAAGTPGYSDPIFIMVEHGEEPKIAEGNHRRDAYAELGTTHVPAEIRYFGHAEKQGTVGERAGMPRTASAPRLTWDEIGERHPGVYGDREAHGDDVEGDGESIGWAASHLAFDRPGHENHEDPYSLEFALQNVPVDRIDYARHGTGDPRVESARRWYRETPDQVVPPVLVYRQGMYQVADGHHRSEAANLEGLKNIPAYVAQSPHEDESFSDGAYAPFNRSRLKRQAFVPDESGLKAAGIAVIAMDTGRVLMQQRSLNPMMCPCGQGVTWDESNGYQHDDGSVSHDEDEFYGQSVSDLLDQGHPELEKEAALSAVRQPGLQNPYTRGDEWFHGTRAYPEELSELGFQDPMYAGSGAFEDPDGDLQGHWNQLLGTHFSADHDIAKDFASGVHSSSSNDRGGDPFRHDSQSVVHARLGLHNPKVYKSEHDMDQEAYEDEHRAGNSYAKHLPELESDDEDERWGLEETWPEAHRIHQQYGQRKIPSTKMEAGHPVRTLWLNQHPDRWGIANRFREKLQAAGYDGIVYGNEYEPSKNGQEANKSAIVFDPGQIQISQNHNVYKPCLTEDEGEHQQDRMPGHGQMKLLFEKEGAGDPIAKEAMPRDESWLSSLKYDNKDNSIEALDSNDNRVGGIHWHRGVITSVDTDPEHQNKGLAGELLDRAREHSDGWIDHDWGNMTLSAITWAESRNEYDPYEWDEENDLSGPNEDGFDKTAALEHDPNEGTWEFPGGKMDPGESARAAAIREFREEVGQDLPPGVFVGAWVSPGGITVAAAAGWVDPEYQKEFHEYLDREVGYSPEDFAAMSPSEQRHLADGFGRYIGEDHPFDARYHLDVGGAGHQKVRTGRPGTTVRVLRVEKPDGTGPFAYGGSTIPRPFGSSEDDDQDLYTLLNPRGVHDPDAGSVKQRQPYADGIPARYVRGRSFGFLPQHNVHAYFTPKMLSGLHERGFGMSEYDVPGDSLVLGRTQVAWRPADATLVSHKSIPEHLQGMSKTADYQSNPGQEDLDWLDNHGKYMGWEPDQSFGDSNFWARKMPNGTQHFMIWSPLDGKWGGDVVDPEGHSLLGSRVPAFDSARAAHHGLNITQDAGQVERQRQEHREQAVPESFQGYKPENTVEHVAPDFAVKHDLFQRLNSVEDGPFYHGTIYPHAPGDEIDPANSRNYFSDEFGGPEPWGTPAKRVFFTRDRDVAARYGEEPGGLFRVEPTGPYSEHPWEKGTLVSAHPLKIVERVEPKLGKVAAKAPVYKCFIYLIQSEKDIDLGNRAIANPDDPDGDMSEQSAWWEIEHAKKNPALRSEVKKGTPWDELELWADKSVRSNREVTAMVAKLAGVSDEYGYLFDQVQTYVNGLPKRVRRPKRNAWSQPDPIISAHDAIIEANRRHRKYGMPLTQDAPQINREIESGEDSRIHDVTLPSGDWIRKSPFAGFFGKLRRESDPEYFDERAHNDANIEEFASKLGKALSGPNQESIVPEIVRSAKPTDPDPTIYVRKYPNFHDMKDLVHGQDLSFSNTPRGKLIGYFHSVLGDGDKEAHANMGLLGDNPKYPQYMTPVSIDHTHSSLPEYAGTLSRNGSDHDGWMTWHHVGGGISSFGGHFLEDDPRGRIVAKDGNPLAPGDTERALAASETIRPWAQERGIEPWLDAAQHRMRLLGKRAGGTESMFPYQMAHEQNVQPSLQSVHAAAPERTPRRPLSQTFRTIRDQVSAGRPELIMRGADEVHSNQHNKIMDNEYPKYFTDKNYDPSDPLLYISRSGDDHSFLAPVTHHTTGENGWLRGRAQDDPRKWTVFPESRFDKAVAPRQQQLRVAPIPEDWQEGDVLLDKDGHQIGDARRFRPGRWMGLDETQAEHFEPWWQYDTAEEAARKRSESSVESWWVVASSNLVVKFGETEEDEMADEELGFPVGGEQRRQDAARLKDQQKGQESQADRDRMLAQRVRSPMKDVPRRKKD